MATIDSLYGDVSKCRYIECPKMTYWCQSEMTYFGKFPTITK